MLRNPRRIAPAVFASLVGFIAATAAARAEPATPASAANADCLAKPSGVSAAGNHWYYRIDRSSGRHCWYQRPLIRAQDAGVQARAPSQARAPARAIVPPPADPPTPISADVASATRDQVPAAPTAAPVQPYSWSTAAPAVTPSEATAAPPSDSVAPAPEPAVPQLENVVAPVRAESPPASPSRVRSAQDVERPAASAADGSHAPALLVAALALLSIFFGSIAARRFAKFLRSRRRGAPRTVAVAPTAPVYPADDAPALVPAMPRKSDIARATRAPLAAPVRRRDVDAGPDMPGRNRETTRALEDNVRELLHRLRNDLDAHMSSASAAPQSQSSEDLDRILEVWRGKRRRSAG